MDKTLIQAGELWHRIVIETVTSNTRNRHGEYVNTWASPVPSGAFSPTQFDNTQFATGSAYKVWARVEQLGFKAIEMARQAGLMSTHRVTVRYNPLINERCRIKFNGKIYTINQIDDVENLNVKMILNCAEFVQA